VASEVVYTNKMNKLTFKIIDGKEKIIADSPSCPDFRIVIDGVEANYFFDVEELKQSGEKAGTYNIAVCFCGERGCSGAEVEVVHKGDEILWEKMWHTDLDGTSDEDERREFNFTENKIGYPDIKKELPFRFDKEEYRALILNLTSHNRVEDIEDKKIKGEAPYAIAIIDLNDAYHYADVFDEERYAWLGWQEYAKYINYEMVIALADRLFFALNPDAKTQRDWTELDAGYDIRIYDVNFKCIYKAHEKLPK